MCFLISRQNNLLLVAYQYPLPQAGGNPPLFVAKNHSEDIVTPKASFKSRIIVLHISDFYYLAFPAMSFLLVPTLWQA